MSISTIIVRNMREADLPCVMQIQQQCYHEIEPESLQAMQAKLHASPHTCFVAQIHQNAQGSHRQIAGYMLVLPWRRHTLPALNASQCELPAQPDCLYLHDLAVMPEFRGYGVGRQLFKAFKAILQHTGFGCATLVAIQNSVSYWRRFGFAPVDASALLLETLSSYTSQARYMELDLRAGTQLPSEELGLCHGACR